MAIDRAAPPTHDAPPRSVRPVEPVEPPIDMSVVWIFLWTLFAFKIGTVVVIFWAARSFEAGVLLTATTWWWLIIPGAALAAPLSYHYRVRRVRAKRQALLRAEWMVSDDPLPRA